MLIGSMLLWTFKILESRDQKKGHANNSMWEGSCELPNMGLILSYYLDFAESYRESCKLNEDGWKHLIVKKADAHQIQIRGLPEIEALVEKLRTEIKYQNLELEEGTGDIDSESLDHWKSCYRDALTTEKELKKANRRRWATHHFFNEVCYWLRRELIYGSNNN